MVSVLQWNSSVTLLQDGPICINRLVNDGLSFSGLSHLLTLYSDLLLTLRIYKG